MHCKALNIKVYTGKCSATVQSPRLGRLNNSIQKCKTVKQTKKKK